MNEQVEPGPERKKNIAHIILLAAAFLLPGILWIVLGWASCFIPLIVFIFITKYGWSYANSHLLIAMLAALFGAYIFQSLELTLFSVSLVPAGYVIAYSFHRNDEPWFSGMLGTATLAVSLFFFFSIIMASSEVSFMRALSDSLSNGIDEALRQYRSNEDLSSENYILLERTLFQMKNVAPVIMPAILGSILMLISWTTIAVGNFILAKAGIPSNWKEYRFWQLPDKLIWLFIASGIFAALPGDITRTAGINCLILVALPYAFQGLAIAVFWLNKWKVPKFVRTLIYVMIFLQSFGTIFLVLLGVADVWFDLRRLNTQKTNSEADKQ